MRNTKSEIKIPRIPYVKKYNSWRIRILYSIIIGYATFYFCRQNFNIATPAIREYFDVTKTQIGWILTASSIMYGVSKFCNGFISDKTNARIFMVLGLLFVGIITILIGFSDSLFLIGILWIASNWFQSMGWPPATKMLTHWFASKELGTKWAMGATSNQIGGALAMVSCGYLIDKFGWRSAFFVPGVVACVVSIFLYNRLRNSPKEVGLSTVEEYKNYPPELISDYDKLPTAELLKIVFCNKLIWYVCLANMFVYIIRLGVIYWAPTFLKDLRGISLLNAGLQIGLYEMISIPGALIAGFLSDKLFQGRRGPVSTICMLALSLLLILFWKLPIQSELLSIVILSLVGFFVSGPQLLVGIAAADFSTRQAVGTANGLSGLCGYLGAAIAGVGVGWISDNYGWDGVFIFFSISTLLGSSLFALTWNCSAKK
ncbi:MFS transporter [Rickettsia sp. MEAM1 (Bemisia tabaci)]|uniref:MFS transporter n=1 Tax=unclassified Rickettsia TaxID=114295 RepID=UPI000302FA93|nr:MULTISPECIES: MFS transporter [unclassified Rickettsia]ASX27759.1 MFS transporter [Rickettsia sp. MEAM1 (Bemisia tabaci)]ODA37669.1 MFS transporter [Rickettsia sp. wb]ODA38458.1 MFS transporter [Rickettsia sp. wq]